MAFIFKTLNKSTSSTHNCLVQIFIVNISKSTKCQYIAGYVRRNTTVFPVSQRALETTFSKNSVNLYNSKAYHIYNWFWIFRNKTKHRHQYWEMKSADTVSLTKMMGMYIKFCCKKLVLATLHKLHQIPVDMCLF